MIVYLFMLHSSLSCVCMCDMCAFVVCICMCVHVCVLVCPWALRLTWWIALPPRSLETGLSGSARLSSLFHSRDCLCSLRTFVECWGSELWSSSLWGKCFTELSAQQPVFLLVTCAYKHVQVRLGLALSHELLPTREACSQAVRSPYLTVFSEEE